MKQRTNILISVSTATALLCAGLVAFGAEGGIEISEVPYTITNSGSYYFTDDLNVTALGGATGIRVYADDVTIDMRGFRLRGTSGFGGDDGIFQPSTNRNLTVRNGTIERFGWGGISTESGIYARGRGNRFEHITVSDNRYGLRSGDDSIIEACSAFSNPEAGIIPGEGSVVRHCAAVSNGSHGFVLDTGSTLDHCTAAKNDGTGFYGEYAITLNNCVARENAAAGFDMLGRAVLTDCISGNNALQGFELNGPAVVTRCIAVTNGEDGFEVSDGATLTECQSIYNQGAGIWLGNRCQVRGCSVISNQVDGIRINGDGSLIADNYCRANEGSGILVPYIVYGNRIENNQVVENDVGIYEYGKRTVVIKNKATQNKTNYYIEGSSPIFSLVSSNGVTTIPWANFEY